MQLPGVDGFAVAEQLAAGRHPPVVVLISSREAAAYGPRLQSAPAHGFIPKRELSGSALAAVVGTDLAGRVQPAPRLVAGVFDVDTQLLARVTLGSLRNGTHRYAARLGRDCLGECRLVSLSLTWTPAVSRADVASTPPSITVHIDRLAERVRGAAWTTVPAGVTDARRWSGTPGAVRLSSAGRTLAAHIRLNYYGAPVTIEPADVPHALPVLTTPESNSTASGDYGPLVVGLDGQTLPGHRVGVVPALPGVPANAVLVDLPAAERFLGGPFKTESTEVWLTTSAPPGIVRRLRSQGVEPVGARTAAGAVAALSRSGLNVAYLLYLICAVAAALLAVATTAFTLASAARRRSSRSTRWTMRVCRRRRKHTSAGISISGMAAANGTSGS